MILQNPVHLTSLPELCIIDTESVRSAAGKDTSWCGRDYLQAGYYTDTYFPGHSIRFIVINDCVDSDDGENELAPPSAMS